MWTGSLNWARTRKNDNLRYHFTIFKIPKVDQKFILLYQTSADKESESPDSSVSSLSSRTDRHRTGFFTKFSTESGQRKEFWQQTDTGHYFPEMPDKNETRTGQEQWCPPTSVLVYIILKQFWFLNVNWFITDYLLNQLTKSLSVNNFRMIIGQSVIITGHFSVLSCS